MGNHGNPLLCQKWVDNGRFMLHCGRRLSGPKRPFSEPKWAGNHGCGSGGYEFLLCALNRLSTVLVTGAETSVEPPFAPLNVGPNATATATQGLSATAESRLSSVTAFR